jgi:hypothetical protein
MRNGAIAAPTLTATPAPKRPTKYDELVDVLAEGLLALALEPPRGHRDGRSLSKSIDRNLWRAYVDEDRDVSQRATSCPPPR